MSRLTITLDDDQHRALKETAARQGCSIAAIIEESLRLRGIQDQASARALVAQARKRAQLDPEKALEVAVEETGAARRRSTCWYLSLIRMQWSLACSRVSAAIQWHRFWMQCGRGLLLFLLSPELLAE